MTTQLACCVLHLLNSLTRCSNARVQVDLGARLDALNKELHSPAGCLAKFGSIEYHGESWLAVATTPEEVAALQIEPAFWQLNPDSYFLTQEGALRQPGRELPSFPGKGVESFPLLLSRLTHALAGLTIEELLRRTKMDPKVPAPCAPSLRPVPAYYSDSRDYMAQQAAEQKTCLV